MPPVRNSLTLGGKEHDDDHQPVELEVADHDPQAVRKALKLRGGDELMYRIDEDGRVSLARVSADPLENPFAIFTEWDSEADHEAFDKL